MEEGLGWAVDAAEIDGEAEAVAAGEKIVFGNGKCLVQFDSRLSGEEQKAFSHLQQAFREAVKQREVRSQAEAAEILRAISQKLSSTKALAPERTALVVEGALHSLWGYGVLDFLLARPELEEISVVGIGFDKPLFAYHRQLGWLETNCFFTSYDEALNAANKMARPLGRRLSYQTPRINSVLPDGSRLHASIAPVCRNGIEITIRKFSEEPFSPVSLALNNTFSLEAAAALWLALYSDLSLVVAGNTGSGKTTTLNSLFSFVPLKERIVVVEETPEISLPHSHAVRLAANEELGVTLRELVLDTLRMRPDRLVIGEVRSKPEAEALADSLLSGQARGCYCTMHAKSAPDALARLRSLLDSSDALSALDLVLVQKRIPVYDARRKSGWEQRRVTEIRFNENGVLHSLFKRDHSRDELKRGEGLKRLFSRLTDTYSMSDKELWQEFEQRVSFLRSLAEQKPPPSFSSFTSSVQEYCFKAPQQDS